MLNKIRSFFLRIYNFFVILSEYKKFSFLQKDKRFSLRIKDLYPCLRDKTTQTDFDRHYVYHTAWAARKVVELKPEVHIDISSSLFFSGILSSFIPVKFYDYRPADLSLSGFESYSGNLLSLPFASDSISSLSCMHVIEHVGLGRYGDPIDPEADIVAMKELIRVLSPGGSLLFVTPVGAEAKISFNAHRVYTLKQIQTYFSELTCVEFTLIPEKKGAPIVHATDGDVSKESYGCGCFLFKK